MVSVNRWPLRVSLLAVSAAAVLGLTTGCHKNEDTGTVVNYDPAASKKHADSQMQDIQSNPHISEHQKQEIMGRYRSMQGSKAGEASVLSKIGNNGAQGK